MKKIFLYLSLFLLLISCESGGNITIQSIDEQSREMIREADILLLQYSFTKDKELYKKVEDIINTLQERSLKNKYFEAKVLGLFGEMEYLSGNKLNLKTYITGIEERNRFEERLFILKCYITDNLDEKEMVLREGIDKSEENFRLKLFLADIYVLKGKFVDASSGYDLAFAELPEIYKSFYEKRRNVARQFVKESPKSIKTIETLLKDQITVRDIIEVCTDEIKILESHKGKKIADTFNKLVIDKFFYDIALKLATQIKRKDIAFFLLKTLSLKEKDESLINKYIVSFPEDDNSNPEYDELSPVPDIKMRDYYYTAVLILVEREIMELPDGENFLPEELMSGVEFYQTIRKL